MKETREPTGLMRSKQALKLRELFGGLSPEEKNTAKGELFTALRADLFGGFDDPEVIKRELNNIHEVFGEFDLFLVFAVFLLDDREYWFRKLDSSVFLPLLLAHLKSEATFLEEESVVVLSEESVVSASLRYGSDRSNFTTFIDQLQLGGELVSPGNFGENSCLGIKLPSLPDGKQSHLYMPNVPMRDNSNAVAIKIVDCQFARDERGVFAKFLYNETFIKVYLSDEIIQSEDLFTRIGY